MHCEHQPNVVVVGFPWHSSPRTCEPVDHTVDAVVSCQVHQAARKCTGGQVAHDIRASVRWTTKPPAPALVLLVQSAEALHITWTLCHNRLTWQHQSPVPDQGVTNTSPLSVLHHSPPPSPHSCRQAAPSLVPSCFVAGREKRRKEERGKHLHGQHGC